jgi:hypothetical protein
MVVSVVNPEKLNTEVTKGHREIAVFHGQSGSTRLLCLLNHSDEPQQDHRPDEGHQNGAN